MSALQMCTVFSALPEATRLSGRDATQLTWLVCPVYSQMGRAGRAGSHTEARPVSFPAAAKRPPGRAAILTPLSAMVATLTPVAGSHMRRLLLLTPPLTKYPPSSTASPCTAAKGLSVFTQCPVSLAQVQGALWQKGQGPQAQGVLWQEGHDPFSVGAGAAAAEAPPPPPPQTKAASALRGGCLGTQHTQKMQREKEAAPRREGR